MGDGRWNRCGPKRMPGRDKDHDRKHDDLRPRVSPHDSSCAQLFTEVYTLSSICYSISNGTEHKNVITTQTLKQETTFQMPSVLSADMILHSKEQCYQNKRPK